jgi:hypothetical protein
MGGIAAPAIMMMNLPGVFFVLMFIMFFFIIYTLVVVVLMMMPLILVVVIVVVVLVFIIGRLSRHNVAIHVAKQVESERHHRICR